MAAETRHSSKQQDGTNPTVVTFQTLRRQHKFGTLGFSPTVPHGSTLRSSLSFIQVEHPHLLHELNPHLRLCDADASTRAGMVVFNRTLSDASLYASLKASPTKPEPSVTTSTTSSPASTMSSTTGTPQFTSGVPFTSG